MSNLNPLPTSSEAGSLDITPELAKAWLTKFKYHGQRPLSSKHVNFLAGQMRAGTFRFCSLRLTGYALPGGEVRWFLTNGQHRLHAAVQFGQTVRFGIERVRVEDLAAVARDYAEQDNIRVRSARDSFAALGLKERWDLTPSQLGKLESAVKVIASDFALIPKQVAAFKSRNDAAALMAPWSQAAGRFFEIIEDTPNSSLLLPAPVMAPALATLREMPDKATSFWCGLAADDGLKAGDARRTLLYFLRQTPRRERANLMLGVAQCWAAWSEGREIVKCEWPREARFSLVGTPWEAK